MAFERTVSINITNIVITLLLILSHNVVPALFGRPSFDYCTLTCGSATHTVCNRQHWCGPVSGCENIESTPEFRKYVVELHNDYRNKIASGETKGPYGNTGAKNMMAVSYDMEMEYIAACWANTCSGLKHDACRWSERFPAGQNLYIGTNKNETEIAVKLWHDEIKDFTDAKWLETFNNENYPSDGKMRGHFTQVIWASTKYIGCARVRYGDSQRKAVICNYGPAGNMLGAPIYKMAASADEVASECEGGVKNTEFTSLCGQTEPIPTEHQWAGSSGLKSCVILIQYCVLSVLFFQFV